MSFHLRIDSIVFR